METRNLGTRNKGADIRNTVYFSVSFTMMREDQGGLEKTRTIPLRDPKRRVKHIPSLINVIFMFIPATYESKFFFSNVLGIPI